MTEKGNVSVTCECWYLNEKEHYLINHKAVLWHMQEMGIQAIYPRQNTSKPEPANKIYPYLLKGTKIDHPDQVWSIDITYIPVKTDWLYLVAIIDWYSRFVLHWKLSDTMEIGFVLDTSPFPKGKQGRKGWDYPFRNPT